MKTLKKLIKASILVVSITSSTFALDVGGIVSNVNIDCSNGGLFSFMDLGDSLCGAADGFSQALGNNFSFGGCSLQVGGDASCYLNSLKNACGSTESMVMDPLKSAVNSFSEFQLLKGSGFKSSNLCGDEPKFADTRYPSGMTQREIYEETDWPVMAKKNYSPFSADIDTARDCMKTSGEKCLDTNAMTLPANSLEVEKKIMEAAHSVAQADQSSSANMASVEAETRKKLDACKILPAAAQEPCEKVVKGGDSSPEAFATKEIAKLELASSVELSLIKKASRGDTYYVYKDKKFIKKLPKELRGEYADGVARQNAADTLIMSLYAELVALKKEAIRANYAGAEVAATPYDAKSGVDALITNFGLNGTETSSGTSGASSTSGTENLVKDVVNAY